MNYIQAQSLVRIKSRSKSPKHNKHTRICNINNTTDYKFKIAQRPNNDRGLSLSSSYRR